LNKQVKRVAGEDDTANQHMKKWRKVKKNDQAIINIRKHDLLLPPPKCNLRYLACET
jgi:hypothetical protein